MELKRQRFLCPQKLSISSSCVEGLCNAVCLDGTLSCCFLWNFPPSFINKANPLSNDNWALSLAPVTQVFTPQSVKPRVDNIWLLIFFLSQSLVCSRKFSYWHCHSNALAHKGFGVTEEGWGRMGGGEWVGGEGKGEKKIIMTERCLQC